MEADTNVFAGHQDEQLVQKYGDTVMDNLSAGDCPSAVDLLQSGLENCNLADDVGANVPTKTCSSLAIRDSKVDLNPIAEDETINESKLSEASGAQVIDVHVDGSILNTASHQSHEPNNLSNVLKAPSVEVDQGVAIIARPEHCPMSGSFPKRSIINQREIDGRFLDLEASTPCFSHSSSAIDSMGELMFIGLYLCTREDK
ncbi:Uncharacterized protein Fot_25915 [Forsythia ovata]|uniref:Uncharacterized protein n=1 Tax=Forsythia ovata TaxID=205694 RepID=A0ABD1UAL2_9LAMI